MLKIIKIGGNIVDNPAKLRAFLADFATLPGEKILIHGGGKIATSISTSLGIKTTMIDGRRVTDARTLEVVTMVYNGINKQIVSTLHGLACNALGLCGADGRLIVSRRRAPEPVDYGFVGDPVAVNTTLVRSLVASGYTLVVAPITIHESTTDEAGNGLLNTNADTVARTLAVALAVQNDDGTTPAGIDIEGRNSAPVPKNDETAAGRIDIPDRTAAQCRVAPTEKTEVELIYCFEKQGVMRDVEDANSVIPTINTAKFSELKSAGIVHSGMLPKLENAFRALEKGVAKVVICAAENIAKPGYGGTTIVK